MDPHIFGDLWQKCQGDSMEGRGSPLHKCHGNDLNMEKINLNSYFTLYIKFNLKCIIHLNVVIKTLKILDLEIQNVFIWVTQRMGHKEN